MRVPSIAAALLAATLALAPGLVFARAGSGASMGSRGGFTYSAPPSTNTAPGMAAPMQRSLAPQSTPGYPGAPMAPGRGGFMSGMMGGLLGAGLFGMLFGGGLFGGIGGFGGFFGFLLQMALIVMVVRFIWRRIAGRQMAFAGAPFTAAGPAPMAMGGGAPAPVQAVPITPGDFQAFEHLLQGVQAAWSEHDLVAMRNLATPEMVSYFADQMAEQASRGVRNIVADVRLEQGDLAQAWAEPGREFATVAMRFSMLDTTVDGAGRVVEGDTALRTQATELWTFLRAPGGAWVLSAIQQTR